MKTKNKSKLKAVILYTVLLEIKAKFMNGDIVKDSKREKKVKLLNHFELTFKSRKQ